MSRRKQAKPQHLKSDEELPPPDGAPEHGEGCGPGWRVGERGREAAGHPPHPRQVDREPRAPTGWRGSGASAERAARRVAGK